MKARMKANPPRPKVKAAGAGAVAVTVLVWLLGLLDVDTSSVPPEVWALVGGGLSTIAAYVKRDGLAGAWRRLVRGAQP